MSFILDALKKAESERSRSSGPVLMDVRVAAPRRRLPTWAWVIGVVLLANLGVLAWLLLRTPVTAPVTGGSATPPPAAAAPSPAAMTPPAPATQPAPASVDPGQAAAAPLPAAPAAPNFNSLPTLQDLAAAGVSLPPLQLNLHVYDASPLHRYVLLNGARLREGEYTADGVKLEAITPEGVVLEASGRRFRMAAGG